MLRASWPVAEGLRRTYGVPVGLGSLAAAEVAKSPGGVSKHAELTAVSKKAQQRAESTLAEDIIAALRAVAGNVTQSPNSLFPDIGLGAAKKLNENRDGTGLDDNLGLGCGSAGDISQGPSGLKLYQGVGRAEELDKAADDASFDDLLDRRVAFLRQELSELGGGLNLEIDLVREDALNHLREVLVQLYLVSMTCMDGTEAPRANCRVKQEFRVRASRKMLLWMQCYRGQVGIREARRAGPVCGLARLDQTIIIHTTAGYKWGWREEEKRANRKRGNAKATESSWQNQ